MDAIIFDLDGTIVFSHPVHFAAYEKLFEEFGIKWSYEEFNSYFAGTGAPAIVQKILTGNGITNFNLNELVQRKRDFFHLILKRIKLKTVPGFFNFLKRIKEKNINKTIASGSHRDNIIDMIKNIGVYKDFPKVVSGEEVAHSKPAPDIFIKAAEMLGAAPSNCIVIEDTDHGVIGAKKAGMKCIALTTTMDKERLLNAGADRIFENYNKIDLNLLLDGAFSISSSHG